MNFPFLSGFDALVDKPSHINYAYNEMGGCL